MEEPTPITLNPPQPVFGQPRVEEEEAEAGERRIELRFTLNPMTQHEATTPSPDFLSGFGGTGPARSDSFVAGGRVALFPFRQDDIPYAGFFAGLYQYRRHQTQGEESLDTRTRLFMAGATFTVESFIPLVGKPEDRFRLGLLAFQVSVGPALFDTRMTHEEGDSSRVSAGLAGGLETRLISFQYGSLLLHAGIEQTVAMELQALSHGGTGRQAYKQLFAPVVTLEKRFGDWGDLWRFP